MGTAVITSCKKNEDEPSKSAMVVGSWTKSFDAEDGNNNKTLDASERVAVTGGDTEVSKFNADGTGTVTLTGTVSGTLPFNWKLINNETDLRVDLGILGADTSRIHTLTATEFIIEDVDGTDYSWTGYKK